MTEHYFVKGVATVKIEGVAKIIAADGKTIRSENLGDVPAFKLPIETLLPMPTDGECGVQFTLANVFRPFNV